MPHRIILTSAAGSVIDGGVFAASFGLIGATIAGIEVDAVTAFIAASSGLMIAAGRTALYLADAYKTVQNAQKIKLELEEEEEG